MPVFPVASALDPDDPLLPFMYPFAAKSIYKTADSDLEGALQRLGWTVKGRKSSHYLGIAALTVIATRRGQVAEVKLFEGHAQDLRDMAQLKGSAQGFGEMAMFTVLVKGDPAQTDELFEALTGRPPIRHGSGKGLPYNRP